MLVAKGLGRGINAFFPDLDVREEEKIQEIALTELRPNPYQPRKNFQKEAIQELAASIKEHGILQPLIVRKSIKGYEIVAGERRYRAAKEACLEKVPAVVRELNEQQMMEFALLENLQREDLNPMEEALAYQMLMDELNVTQEQLAKRLGKSRPYIANYVRLLTLPLFVQEMIANGSLSMAHGRTLLTIKDEEQLKSLLKRIEKEGLNVRQLEQIVQQIHQRVSRETKTVKRERNIFFEERETLLREKFGTGVKIKETKKEKGKIEIEFFDKEDLNRILELLSGEN
ncbi:chromosome partitioning protein ParB [Bacillus pseudomycoides]|uniref:Chromosome partitioning protein ParB n=1 Tax=Bacillus pseudomycoides TaxID=64104 RepID=A0ABD6TDH4_9BACI|nr:chromosome partitioning protein ParB [Bacillus pseudomycoides]PDY14374.1 chromosome partitioning protein ParB [Bacillus pseudomycoides]PDZ12451.1 chromosome partitioning protein ParB [Bacillus pseudomycoides]PDZ72718.1 chromosome partitioning protein ParB [Bacillus pseudomycoides]PEF23977.1 chromosome partitioning protein ParB [Bacillus pseudomycoides]